ncbi:MAG: LysR family transcriptional regulator ArgP, partial [Desulfobacteraceae bacterium]
RRMSLSNIHYVPSSEIFARMIITGAACGMIPDLQSLSQVRSGGLLDLAPEHHIRVDLYWHRWNLDSLLLDQFSRAMIQHANIY